MTKTVCPRCGGDTVHGHQDVYVCGSCLKVWSETVPLSGLRNCPICDRPIVGTKSTHHKRLVLSSEWEVLEAEEAGETQWTVRCENGHSVAEMINHLHDSGNSAP